MAPPLLQSSYAPFFLSAFEAIPASGRLRVPLPSPALGGAHAAQELTPATVTEFALVLHDVFSEMQEMTAKSGSVMTSFSAGDEAWTSIWGGPKHLILENFEKGLGYTFDRGGHRTRQLIGNMQGCALTVKRLGAFASIEMTQAFSLQHRMRWLPTSYRLEFRECALEGLKTLLGFPQDASVFDLGMKVFALIDTTPIPAPSDPAPWEDLLKRQRPHSSSLETHADAPGFALSAESNLEIPYPELGFVSEVLKLELSHAITSDQSLPAPFRPLWEMCRESIRLHPAPPSSATREALDAYWGRTRDLYGDLENLMPS